jgi:NADH-quinone oxidoreductase subunit L
MSEAILFVVLFPLLGFLAVAFLGKAISERAAAITACVAVGLSFVAALLALLYVLRRPEGMFNPVFEYTWTVAGNWRVSFGLLTDPLSVWMSLIVSGVGLLIHIYSIGYMKGEHDYRRFFAYLNLFVFTMLVLVTADNFVSLLVGWGGVGLSSFLLIGFYKDKESAVAAARKALVMNTIGDAGLMLAIFLIILNTGSAQFNLALTSTTLTDGAWNNYAAILLLVAAIAKSAQLPLHTWLPDAMEGPTPVSALIHAATMVTAGVYLVTRAHELFIYASLASTIVVLIGVASAFYAATCAIAQTDIKRVLAYSTMSQLGYMFMAAGVGAYEAAMFHLMTHAFFKALLFLSAGAVIHALDGEQDMRNMGGLRKQMPFTAWMFLIGALAISGIPPLAGFFSKESILAAFPLFSGVASPESTSTLGGTAQLLIGWVGVIVALMTAFYMFRAYFMTFEGVQTEKHAHKNPTVMNAPLAVLAVFSVIAGFVVLPGAYSLLAPYFEPVHSNAQLGYTIVAGNAEPEVFTVKSDQTVTISRDLLVYKAAETGKPEWRTTAEPANVPGLITEALVGVIGISIAFAVFGRRAERAEIKPLTGLSSFLYYGWHFDKLYHYLFVVPTKWLADLFTKDGDKDAAEGLDFVLGGSTWAVSKGVRKSVTGYARNYALGILFGTVGILIYVAIIGLQR